MWNSDEAAAAYLAGMIDGEGSVIHGRWGNKTKSLEGKKQYRVVICYNTDLSIIEAAEGACIRLGYAFRRKSSQPSQPNRLRKYEVVVYQAESIRRILEEVPIRAALKKARLQEMVMSFRRVKVPDAALLNQLYVVERRPIKELCEVFELSRPQLWRYIVRAGLKRGKIAQGKQRAKMITQELLYRLYITENRPVAHIVEALGVTSDTLYHQLKVHGIPRGRYRRPRAF